MHRRSNITFKIIYTLVYTPITITLSIEVSDVNNDSIVRDFDYGRQLILVSLQGNKKFPC
jgi:hypothetical protein